MCGTNFIIFLFFIAQALTDNIIGYSKVEPCREGDIVLNACNDCLCKNGIFQCKQKKCFKFEYLKDIVDKLKCIPNVAYQRNATVCVCKENGRWPHKKCDKMLQSLIKTVKRCKPNTYIFVECNTCRCNEDGIIDKDHCTRNKCENINEERKSLRRTSNKNFCDRGVWYSLGPCQLCYCSRQDRMVCRKHENVITESLDKYKLSVCGKDFLKNAMKLRPKSLRVLDENDEDIAMINEPEAKKVFKTIHYNEILPKSDVKIYSQNKVLSKTNKTIKNLPEIKEEDDKDNVYNKEEMIISESQSIEKIEQEEEPVDNREDDNYSIETAPKSGDEVKKTIMSTGFPPNEDFSSKEINEAKQMVKKSNANAEAEPEEVTTNVPTLPAESYPDEKYKKNVINGSPFSKVNIPYVLNKVFNLGFRKVNLVSKSKCMPGTVETVSCNKCFCLKNSKMVCTNKVCN